MLVTGKNAEFAIFVKREAGSQPQKLVMTGKNIVRPDGRKGYLSADEKELLKKNSKEHITSKWFYVDSNQDYLTMSGDAYNRAVWQFETADGELFRRVPAHKKYRLSASKLMGRTFPKVRIPKGAVRARVFYCRTTDAETLPLGERLQIEYGLVPTFYEEYREQKIRLKDTEGENAFLFFCGYWYSLVLSEEELSFLVQKKTQEELFSVFENRIKEESAKKISELKYELSQGCQVYFEANQDGTPVEPVPMREYIFYGRKETMELNGVYGIRHRLADSVPLCERTGEARGLNFSFYHPDGTGSPYENDFDSIYPWSAIRKCVVSFQNGSRRVIYEGDGEYNENGSAGEVMVEIPKHYVRRVVSDGAEEIQISAIPREGFELDPSFKTKDGERDCFYIGAYFATYYDKMLHSKKGARASFFHTAKEYVQAAQNNPGFEICDIPAVLTVQRLFLVETACLDSQGIFEGCSYLPYLISDKYSAYYALEDAQKSKSIRLISNSISERFKVGDIVMVTDLWGNLGSAEYPNVYRKVSKREEQEDGTVRIYFTGEPVDIRAHDTGICCLPYPAGTVGKLPGGTGMVHDYFTQNGHYPFTYRGIENVWGGIWIVLSHCRVTNSKLFIEYPDGRQAVLSYSLPEQMVELSSKVFGNPSGMCVKRMGYDENNPLIALPEAIGEGASTCSYYCDAWYNNASPDRENIVTYGGAWDNMGYAGIFSFRASFTEDQKVTFNGARLMCRL